jgi:hypothetical protein
VERQAFEWLQTSIPLPATGCARVAGRNRSSALRSFLLSFWRRYTDARQRVKPASVSKRTPVPSATCWLGYVSKVQALRVSSIMKHGHRIEIVLPFIAA